MRLERKHYLILTAMLISIGTQITGLEHGWHDALSPTWVGGLLIQIGSTLAALYVGAPASPKGGVIDKIAESIQ